MRVLRTIPACAAFGVLVVLAVTVVRGGSLADGLAGGIVGGTAGALAGLLLVIRDRATRRSGDLEDTKGGVLDVLTGFFVGR